MHRRQPASFYFVDMCAYALITTGRPVMKSSRTTLVATAIPLLLTSLPLAAGELPFNAPATVRAKESAPLLHQTARALYDLPSSAALPTSNDKHITNLWLFPTADGETVFARYNLTSGDEPTSGAA